MNSNKCNKANLLSWVALYEIKGTARGYYESDI